MILALTVVGVIVVVALLGLFFFGLRRRLIQRSGGTFDCSLRWDVSEPAPVAPSAEPATESGPGASAAPDRVAHTGATAVEPDGKGWVYGVARYNGDRVEWFRVFSYAPRPRRLLRRGAIEVLERRHPQGEEELALLSDSLILTCRTEGTRVELAMSEDALTGFLAWLEAAPPGQRVNVA